MIIVSIPSKDSIASSLPLAVLIKVVCFASSSATSTKRLGQPCQSLRSSGTSSFRDYVLTEQFKRSCSKVT